MFFQEGKSDLNYPQIPSIIVALTNNSFLFDMYDVSSVKSIVTGSAAFGPKLAEALEKIQPTWQILPGYGKCCMFRTTHDLCGQMLK